MKPRFLRLCVAALAVAGFLAASPRASAGTISLTFDSGTNGTPVTYNPSGGASKTVTGGPFHWTQTTPINAAYDPRITTYCIDLGRGIPSGSVTYTTSTNLATASTINVPGNTAATNLKVSEINNLFERYYMASPTSNYSAAFQLALWELVYDGGASKSLAAGTIQGNNSLAQQFLNGTYTPSGGNMNGYHLEVLTNSYQQNQIMVVKDTVTPKGVPAPPAVMLAGIGVLALFGRARWTRRTPAAA